MKPTTAHEIEEVLQKYIDLRIKNEKILTILDSHKTLNIIFLYLK